MPPLSEKATEELRVKGHIVPSDAQGYWHLDVKAANLLLAARPSAAAPSASAAAANSSAADVGAQQRAVRLQAALAAHDLVKIADFGLSRPIERPGGTEKLIRGGGGTLSHMAQERLRDGKVFLPTVAEAWSVGVTLFELLAGWLPFRQADEQDCKYRAVREAQRVGACEVLFKAMRIAVPFSKPTERLVDGLLRTDPTQRLTIGAALEMAEEALLALEQTQPALVQPPPQPALPQPPPQPAPALEHPPPVPASPQAPSTTSAPAARQPEPQAHAHVPGDTRRAQPQPTQPVAQLPGPPPLKSSLLASAAPFAAPQTARLNGRTWAGLPRGWWYQLLLRGRS
jgi:serine/threonine protein kinase